MTDYTKDILRELTSRHMRLSHGPALVTIDTTAKVMYVVSGTAPVRIRCISLAAKFEPIDYHTDKNYSFAPKKVFLADNGKYIILVGNTCVVAFYVYDFMRDTNVRGDKKHVLKSRILIKDITVCDCCWEYKDKVLILVKEALLRVNLGNSEEKIPEEIAYFDSSVKYNPLKVFIMNSRVYWILFDDNSIEIIL